jgi:Flp pilus assembly protein TadG
MTLPADKPLRPLSERLRARRAAQGANMVFTVILLAVIITFLGLAMHLGTTVYVQEELQKATSTATLIGASSLFDGASALKPTYSSAKGKQVANDTFTDFKGFSGILNSYGAQVDSLTVNDAKRQISMTTSMLMPTPFLSLAGINRIKVTSQSVAQYVAQQPTAYPATLLSTGTPEPGVPDTFGISGIATNPLPALPSGGAGSTLTTASCSLPAGSKAGVNTKLIVPLVDRAGPDVYVGSASGRGYMVFACTDQECWDIGMGAKPANASSQVRDTTLDSPGGVTRKVLYGSFYIDLGATVTGDSSTVSKAAYLRIIDDGFPDKIDPATGAPILELCPQAVSIDQVQIFHSATLCVNETMCAIPSGFVDGTKIQTGP